MTAAAAERIAEYTDLRPRCAVVLGSGLSGAAALLEDRVEIPFAEIPGWPPTAAAGHPGVLAFGRLEGAPLALQCGRVHLYEGFTPQQVVFGVRVLRRLGVERLILTNAAGAINPLFEKGSLVLVSDHINLQGANPLVGLNDDTLGPRFPDMSEAYSSRLRRIARQAAAELGITLAEGVYAGLLGPCYETPAEIRFLRTIGADLVGMSTVPEVIAATHCGMEVLGISCVTNLAAGRGPQKLSHEEVLATGLAVVERLAQLLRAVVLKLA